MPDRKFTYQVEIDVNQARNAARQLRGVFEQELRNVNAGSRGVGGGVAGGGGIGPNLPGMLGGALGFSVAGLGVGMVAGRVLAFGKELADLNRQSRLASAGLVALVGSETEAAERARIVQEAMGGAVSKIEAMQQATQLAALGFADTRQEMERFIRAAQGASVATGRTVDYITQQLTLAISNQSVMRLDQLGLSASEVKDSIAELTAAHADWSKEMVFSEAVLGRLEDKYGGLADAAKENASGFAQLTAAVTDFKTAISAAGGPIDEAAKGLAGFFRGAVDSQAAGSMLAEMLRSSDPALAAYRDRLTEIALQSRAAGGMTVELTAEVARLYAQLGGGGVGNVPMGAQIAGSTTRSRPPAPIFGPPPYSPNTPTGGLNFLSADELGKQRVDLLHMQAEAIRDKMKLDEQAAEKAARDWERAADDASAAWEQAAQEFESRLSRVPGLMGTSDVTQGQMDLAGMGVGQNFADNYLRRLSDEVLNKTDWADVDLGEAARLGGIDQGLPPEAQLALFRQKWESSSLFANPEALKLIDQGAVREALAEQQRSEQGRANILKLFGLDEEMAPQDQEKLLGTGVNMVNEIHNGFADQASQKDWVGAITNALLAQAQGISQPTSTAPAALGDLSGALGITP
jgi:hypothetical protein